MLPLRGRGGGTSAASTPVMPFNSRPGTWRNGYNGAKPKILPGLKALSWAPLLPRPPQKHLPKEQRRRQRGVENTKWNFLLVECSRKVGLRVPVLEATLSIHCVNTCVHEAPSLWWQPHSWCDKGCGQSATLEASVQAL